MTIKLLFSRSHQLGSYFIRWITWSDWSHVEFVTDDGFVIGAVYPGGVMKYPLATRLAESSAYEYCTVVKGDYQKALDFLTKQIGKPYDVTAIFGILTHRDWEEDDRWFCSEMQTAAIKESNDGVCSPVRKVSWRVTPQDLYQSPCLRDF